MSIERDKIRVTQDEELHKVMISKVEEVVHSD
jgi:hypothetical protein